MAPDFNTKTAPPALESKDVVERCFYGRVQLPVPLKLALAFRKQRSINDDVSQGGHASKRRFPGRRKEYVGL